MALLVLLVLLQLCAGHQNARKLLWRFRATHCCYYPTHAELEAWQPPNSSIERNHRFV
jgi:hypothetical protein